MKNTRIFQMNGKKYSTLMEIARELGRSRVYPRDFEKLGIVELTGEEKTEDADAVVISVESQVTESTKKEDKAEESKVEEKSKKVKTSEVKKNGKAKKEVKKEEKEDKAEVKVDKRIKRHLGTAEEIEEAQKRVSNMTVVEFNNFIKHFSVEALETMAESIGVKTWGDIDNEPIRKMRLLMEIKSYYFPNDKTPVKPRSNWKKVSLEELLKLAKKNKLKFKKSDDTKIQRMWVIFELNKAGLTLEDLKKKGSSNA